MLTTVSRCLSAAALFLALLLSGCAAMDTATSIYNTAKGGTELYHSATSIKDMTNFNPAFAGYSSVLVLADIRPRDDAPEAPAAFAQNMAVYTGSVARTVRAPLQVCYVMNQCAGRILVLNFKEDDRNIVQKLTVGDKTRGRLLFTDSASGQIVDEKRVELAETYAELAQRTSGIIVGAMLKSFPTNSTQENERIGAELEKIPTVAPQYEKILGKAS
jgi:hypothetical protein